MKAKEMRNLNSEQLREKILEWKQELFKISVAASKIKRTKTPHLFPKLRRQIAGAYTLLNQKQANCSVRGEDA